MGPANLERPWNNPSPTDLNGAWCVDAPLYRMMEKQEDERQMKNKKPSISPAKLLRLFKKVYRELDQAQNDLDKAQARLTSLLEDVGDQLLFIPREIIGPRKIRIPLLTSTSTMTFKRRRNRGKIQK